MAALDVIGWMGASLLTGFAAAFMFVGCCFLRSLRRARSDPASTSLPHAAVLLAIRQTDPHLAECVRSLVSQDYPSYELHIVLDDTGDDAWEQVSREAREARDVVVRISALQDRLEACSSKCSALLQMARRLPAEVEVVALVDGDVVPHARWLRELVVPMADPAVGATFGIPWCAPAEAGWGSLLRAQWWALASITMALRGWPWGGSSALRRELLSAGGLAEMWAASLSADTPIPAALTNLELRARWVPSLVLLDREESTLAAFFPQLVRYFLIRRLYLPGWSRARSITALFTLALSLNIAAVALSGAGDESLGGLLSASAILVFLLAVGAVLTISDINARSVMRTNGLGVPVKTWPMYVRCWLTLPLLFPLLLVANVIARNTASVTWRGVRYRVAGAWQVRITRERRNSP